MDPGITPAALREALQSPRPPLVVDVRRNERFYEATDMIAGALRCDPLRVDSLGKRLPGAAQVIVYCVHGHEVSQEAARRLGARDLEGGIAAWRAAGGETLPKPAQGRGTCGASSRARRACDHRARRSTARLDLAPQAAGLAAISLGLSINFRDDLEMLEHGMLLYDALYAWCREGRDEVHAWKPEASRAA